MMHLYYLQHVAHEGLGAIEDLVKDLGVKLTPVRLYQGELPPRSSEMEALIVMGGPMGVADDDDYPWLTDEKRFLQEMLERDIPMLGICLGAQLIAHALGANVHRNPEPEIGWFPIQQRPEAQISTIGQSLPNQLTVFHWHGDTFDIPNRGIPLYSSVACRNQGFIFEERIIGLQFHFEMTPQSVADLVTHADADLINAPFVQKKEQILRSNAPFAENRHALKTMLSAWLSH